MATNRGTFFLLPSTKTAIYTIVKEKKKTEKSQQGETEFPWHLIFFKKSK